MLDDITTFYACFYSSPQAPTLHTDKKCFGPTWYSSYVLNSTCDFNFVDNFRIPSIVNIRDNFVP